MGGVLEYSIPFGFIYLIQDQTHGKWTVPIWDFDFLLFKIC